MHQHALTRAALPVRSDPAQQQRGAAAVGQRAAAGPRWRAGRAAGAAGRHEMMALAGLALPALPWALNSPGCARRPALRVHTCMHPEHRTPAGAAAGPVPVVGPAQAGSLPSRTRTKGARSRTR